MATKKFIIEVEEGYTRCDICPLRDDRCEDFGFVDKVTTCSKYNLSTIKIKELEEEKCEK